MFKCPHCQANISLGGNLPGTMVPCWNCQNQVRVPATPSPSPSPTALPVSRSTGPVTPTQPLPDFRYRYLNLGQTKRRVTFDVVRKGTVKKVSKTVKTFVSGGGGGGSLTTDASGRISGSIDPVSIFTTHETTMELWINEGVKESCLQIDEEIPMKKGHKVSVVEACLEDEDPIMCLIIDHTAKDYSFFDKSFMTIKMTDLEWKADKPHINVLLLVCALMMILALPLFCGTMWLSLYIPLEVGMIVSLFLFCCGALGAVLLLVTSAIQPSDLARRRSALQIAFEKHCDKIARMILK